MTCQPLFVQIKYKLRFFMWPEQDKTTAPELDMQGAFLFIIYALI